MKYALFLLFALVLAQDLQPNDIDYIPEATIIATNPYAFGHAVGSTFQKRIVNYFESDPEIIAIVNFTKTDPGRALLNSLANVNTEFYKDIGEEIRGLADGAGLPIETVLCAMLRSELGTFVPNDAGRECTDFLAMGEDGHIWHAHNEDWGDAALHFTYILHADLRYPNRPRCTYTAYSYPGVLPGNAFGYNGFGLTISTNALAPNDVTADGLGRYFINHDAMCASSLTDIIARIESTAKENGGPGRASGYSTNIGSMHEKRIANIEVAQSKFDVLELKRGEHTVHSNHYVRMVDIPQRISNSTAHRYARAVELPPVTSLHGAWQAVGDMGDQEYPIYRSTTPPDTLTTIASVVYDVTEGKAFVYRHHGTTLQEKCDLVWKM